MELALKLVTSSQVIHIGPTLVYGVSISGDAAAGDCDIYDGVNSSAEKKIHLETASGTSFNLPLGEGAKFNYGIYAVVNAVTTDCMILYQPLEQ